MLSESQVNFIESQISSIRLFVTYAKSVDFCVFPTFPVQNYTKMLQSIARIISKAWLNKEAEENWVKKMGHEAGLLDAELKYAVKMIRLRKENMIYS
jgi:hypothetical protein